MNSRRSGKAFGFTLIELLVAVGIVTLMLGLLLPAVQMARESARRMSCSNNLKQVAVAIQDFDGSHKHFPAGRVGCDDTGDIMAIPACPPALAIEKKTAASGFVTLLPQLEQQPLHDRLSVDIGGLWNRNVDDLGWYADEDKCQAIKVSLPVLRCPSDTSAPLSDVYRPVIAATGSYAFSQGSMGPGNELQDVKYANNGAFLYVTPRRTRHVTDGLSHTFFIGEVLLADSWESSNTWTYSLANADCLRNTANRLNTLPGAGYVYERQNGAFGSQHRNGALFAFGDGHVRFVEDVIERRIYRALSTISTGETVGHQ